jgi:hypothetical protein
MVGGQLHGCDRAMGAPGKAHIQPTLCGSSGPQDRRIGAHVTDHDTMGDDRAAASGRDGW